MVAASLEVMEAALNNRPARTDLVEVVRARARAEWVEWSTLVGLADAEEAEIRAGDSPGVMKLVELSAIPGDIGRSVHWSEGQVSYRVAQARRLRDHTPKVWDAFRSGSIDGAKAREVSAAVDKLERSASIERLDRQVVAYAESHTVAELRRWLKVFVARVEADLFNERAEKARDNRGVEVVHGGDGMSQLFADLASMDAAAINYRLDKEARALGADDPRTMDQRRADLLAGWCLTNETGQAAVNANIAVTLTGSTLAGTDHYPAVSGDGTWIVPTQWILDLAKNTAKRVFAVESHFAAQRLVAGVEHISELSLAQLKRVLDAYADRDLAAAREVWERDDEIDAMYTSLFRELLTYMMEDPRNITFCTHLLFCAKNIERIGDHATNIAETIYYIVTGEQMPVERPKEDKTHRVTMTAVEKERSA